ncbi:DUF4918 family protein [Adhaeribacter sp. BT258]|uniref:DUF4918 family protein n=1 Tax=Adhaeribacter terrigena TaxID=2793070 RepID=A0ABS1BYW5_9BACT|nr:uracil-DNA glycosylase family protein [Adhaeribacter terrigena]MBK0402300.1 DUF4918 family protein [Adhaeribacter terrigena]
MSWKTFADKIIEFNKELHFSGILPVGVKIMNPFRESPEALAISSEFYRRYYNDTRPRHMILGINPGRFGSAVTGIPFTDTKRLESELQLPYSGKQTHEPSSVFVYDMIRAFGGPAAFYSRFFVHSICPLGFTKTNARGQEVNYNYYDDPLLTAAVYDFIVATLKQQLSFGISTNLGFCFGKGKNEKFLRKLNAKENFFQEIIALEHPRFIMQYKAKTKEVYIDKYLQAFQQVG